MTSYYQRLVRKARSQASSEDHARFYEKYADQLETASDHAEAAKTFITLNDLNKDKDAVRRYLPCWSHKEPYQVAPIVLFTEHELWPVLSDRHFTESLLAIPHTRRTRQGLASG